MCLHVFHASSHRHAACISCIVIQNRAMSMFWLRWTSSACKLLAMTTLYVVNDEPLAAAVARRLREVLAGIKLSQKNFGELTGWGRGYVQQRYSGLHPLDVADLE